MEAFVRSGHAADIVLLAMVVEFVLLVRSGRPAGAALAALLPGGLIVLALRAALIGADWPWVLLPLAASLPLHLADLARRGWLSPAARRNLFGLIPVKPGWAYAPRRGK